MNRPLLTLAALTAFAVPAVADPLKDAVRQLNDGSEAEKVQAIQAIAKLGPAGAPAIPALIEAVKDGPPASRAWAARVLATFGPAAREAIPVLVRAMQEPRAPADVVLMAIEAIAALGDPGNRDVVLRCLIYESQGRGGRRVVVPVSDYVIRHAADTVPVVADLLAESDPPIRRLAAFSLAYMAAPPAADKPSIIAGLSQPIRVKATEALRASLDDPDKQVRTSAAASLIQLDPSAVERTIPILLNAYRPGNSATFDMAALTRTGPAGARVVLEYVDEPDLSHRHMVGSILAHFDDTALAVMLDGLRHSKPRVREGVLRGLAFAKRGEKVRPAVVARLRDPDAAVRLAAASTLTALDAKRADAAVPVLAELVFDRDSKRRLEALSLLYQLGPLARPAVSDLMRRTRASDAETRFAAAEAMWAADPSTWQSFVPVFIATLKAEPTDLRQRAITRLRQLGRNARNALPALRERFADTDPMIRISAAEALVAIDRSTAAEAVACLTTVIREHIGGQNRRLPRAAMRALDKMGPAAKAAVPALVELLRADPDAGYSPEIANTVVRLDPEQAGEVYDMFREHLSPGNPNYDEEWLYQIPRLKKLARPLLPELMAALHSKHDVQRAFALSGLEALGMEAAEALPALREMAKGKLDTGRALEVIKAIEAKK